MGSGIPVTFYARSALRLATKDAFGKHSLSTMSQSKYTCVLVRDDLRDEVERFVHRLEHQQSSDDGGGR